VKKAEASEKKPKDIKDLLNDESVNEYFISDDITTIGRIETNDIFLQDDMVSGHHAKVSCSFCLGALQV